jgi:indole-3-glycerol phosphate synthase
VSILDQILKVKEEEVAALREEVSLERLLGQIDDEPAPRFSGGLQMSDLAVIAEIKYSSPSHGPFHCQDSPETVARSYALGGAAALSVLTDERFFQGSLAYLDRVRQLQKRRWALSDEEYERQGLEEWRERRLPMLRKDFIIDRYQVVEARVRGASAYLLIVAGLAPQKLADLIRFGEDLGLEALVEVHDERELDVAVEAGSRLIGVNNRNLRTFEVDLGTSFTVARHLEGESGFTLVAESGISERSQLLELRDAGFSGFLIGTTFMESDDPGRELAKLLGTSSEDSESERMA